MSEQKASSELPNTADELICFAVYSAGHAFNRAYTPLLKKMNLTYPQYILLTVLWEEDHQTVGSLCHHMKLDSGTVTPLLKRLETLGHIQRKRSETDERRVIASLTDTGRALQSYAGEVTKCIVGATGMDLQALDGLVETIHALRDNLMQAPKQG